jgi:hypothetical protein
MGGASERIGPAELSQEIIEFRVGGQQTIDEVAQEDGAHIAVSDHHDDPDLLVAQISNRTRLRNDRSESARMKSS